MLTAGSDLQVDRIETTLCGWTRDGQCLVLDHVVHWGPPDEDRVWRDLDDLLKSRWPHPLGGTIGVDSAVIDSGFQSDAVYKFCFPRAGRRDHGGQGPERLASDHRGLEDADQHQNRACWSRLDRRRRRDQNARCSRSWRGAARSGSRSPWSRAFTSNSPVSGS